MHGFVLWRLDSGSYYLAKGSHRGWIEKKPNPLWHIILFGGRPGVSQAGFNDEGGIASGIVEDCPQEGSLQQGRESGKEMT
jgi:hypothetical protein